MFGKSTSQFSKQHLHQLCREWKKDEVHKYIDTYFLRTFNCDVVMWDHYHQRVASYSPADVASTFLTKLKPEEGYSPFFYFFKVNEKLYQRVIEIAQPKVFEDKGGYFVNTFGGFLHQNRPETFSPQAIEGVKLIWRHIYEIWTSGTDDQFTYIKNWIASAVSGRKMTTCLYLKSGQGTGKSIITSFIKNKVLGSKIFLAESDPDVFRPGSHASEQLDGKIFLCLEEPTTSSLAQWGGLANNLKNYITGDEIKINPKNKTCFTTQNWLSIMIASNHEAIKIDTDDRRFVSPDISNARVGDTPYWEDLVKCTEGNISKEVGEAFFWNCCDLYAENMNFSPSKLPKTLLGQELVLKSLHSLYVYIKDNYVLKKRGMNIKLVDFEREYNEWLKTLNKKPLSKYDLIRLIKDKKIPIVKGSGNHNYIRITADNLLDIYTKLNWIHNTDVIEEDTEGYQNDVDIINGMPAETEEAWDEGEKEVFKMMPDELLQKVIGKNLKVKKCTVTFEFEDIDKLNNETKNKCKNKKKKIADQVEFIRLLELNNYSRRYRKRSFHDLASIEAEEKEVNDNESDLAPLMMDATEAIAMFDN